MPECKLFESPNMFEISLLYFRELCLVRAHDMKLTKEAERAQKDLAQALLDAEKNAK
jgi:hypothetical protein